MSMVFTALQQSLPPTLPLFWLQLHSDCTDVIFASAYFYLEYTHTHTHTTSYLAHIFNGLRTTVLHDF